MPIEFTFGIPACARHGCCTWSPTSFQKTFNDRVDVVLQLPALPLIFTCKSLSMDLLLKVSNLYVFEQRNVPVHFLWSWSFISELYKCLWVLLDCNYWQLLACLELPFNWTLWGQSHAIEHINRPIGLFSSLIQQHSSHLVNNQHKYVEKIWKCFVTCTCFLANNGQSNQLHLISQTWWHICQ